jgi:hypothetical protein
VYKLSKALYRFKHAPQAWYAKLKTFLLEHVYVIRSVDQTLFTLNHGTDFLLVQIYVDDIIFGSSSHSLASSFQEMMENEFQMSMMGELTFFLGTQVKQMKQGTFVHQAKYTKDLMKKLNMAELKPVSTLMSIATSPCACLHAFRLPHPLNTGQQFNRSSGISNTHSSLGFGILLLR